MYAIIDCETTGFSSEKNKIIEIAIVQHDGEKITNQYHTLINPNERIPTGITKLNGISDLMVVNAPKFEIVAKTIVEMTKGRILIGHNVAFDFAFLKKEFSLFKFSFQYKRICTVRLAKIIKPDLKSYSLGNLCKYFGIDNNSPHRALADALATARLFEILKASVSTHDFDAIIHEIIRDANLPAGYSYDDYHSLPGTHGVYYFKDRKDKIIYIGKSNNIKDRVHTHFNHETKWKKDKEMTDKIFDVGYFETGSELLALLIESAEIKQHLPIYNIAQRRTQFPFGLFHFYDNRGYLHFYIDNAKTMPPLMPFQSQKTAKSYLEYQLRTYNLCQSYCHFEQKKKKTLTTYGPCFQRQLHNCFGACCGEEDPTSYNERAEMLLNKINLGVDNCIIFEKGRTAEEIAVVCIEKSMYLGYAYLSKDTTISTIEQVKPLLTKGEHNKDIQSILKKYLLDNKDTDKILLL